MEELFAVAGADANRLVHVRDTHARERHVRRREACLNVVAAKEVAEKMGKGSTVVTLLCDGAYRYADRLFSKKWLEQKKLYDAIPERLRRYIVLE